MTAAPVDLTAVVKVNGQELAPEAFGALEELRVETGLNRVGWASLTFIGADLAPVGKIGDALAIAGPAGSPLLFTGKVSATEVDAGSDLQQRVVLTAHDDAYRMAYRTTVKVFEHMSVADRIRQFAAPHFGGVDIAIPGDTAAVWSAQGATDLETLTEMATRAGVDWWVDGSGTLHVHKLRESSPTTLTYGDHEGVLQSVSVRRSAAAPHKVEVNGWDVDKGEVVKGVSAAPGVDEWKKAHNDPTGLHQGTLQVTGIGRPQSAHDADTLSKAVHDRLASASVVVRGRCIGFHPLAPGSWVTLAGVGDAGNGTYPVAATTYLLRPGRPMETRFHAGDRSPRDLGHAIGAAGSGGVHHHLGLLEGKISSIEDPERAGRVRVHIPAFGDRFLTDWARIIVPGGGSDRGSFLHHEVGDEVVVAFEGGDLSSPVVLGGVLSKSGKGYVPVDVRGGAATTRTIKTRVGHMITFDDTEGFDKGVLVTLKDGKHLVHITPKKVSVTSSDGAPIELASGAAKVTLDGNGAKITLDSPGSMLLKAAQKIELQATQVAVQGTASVEVKGAQVKVDADATAAVQAGAQLALKGGMVMVN